MSLVVVAACSGAEPPESSSDPVASGEPSPVTSSATITTSTSVPPVEATATTAPPTSTTAAASGELAGWDTWTLIYASLPVEEHDHDDAVAIAQRIAGADVLLSDNYPSLNPGYFVVYAGAWGNRHQAGIWCPDTLDAELTCYPRYLGHSVTKALASGAAIVELGDGRLVIMEPATAEHIATFDRYFGGDGAYPSRFTLTADRSALFYNMGYEDSWYSCESERGEIRRLDLDSGTELLWGDGWSPAVSPDGRWLAIVAAADCYPDPEVAEWFVAPGSQVEVYDLLDGDSMPDYILRPSVAPIGYDNPSRVRMVRWDPAEDGELVVWMADGTARSVAYGSGEPLDEADLIWASEIGELVAVTADRWYVLESGDDSSVVIVTTRSDPETVGTFEFDGWISGFALGRGGEVIITTWEYLILPNGERVDIDGGVNNLSW